MSFSWVVFKSLSFKVHLLFVFIVSCMTLPKLFFHSPVFSFRLWTYVVFIPGFPLLIYFAK
jgi:hypothetical protein